MADVVSIVPFVEGKFTQAQGFATSAYQTTMEALLALEQIAEALTLINRTIHIDTTTVSAEEITEEPPVIDISKFTVDMPDLPPDPQLVDASMGSLPNFPDLVVGDVKEMANIADPQVVDASAKGLPSFPGLVVGDLHPPNEQYASSLLSAIQAKLLSSTGLTPAIEDAIFKREYERSILVEQDLEDGIAADWSGRGWPLPSGALKAGLDQARINFANKRLDISRDVSIKSFELALENYHFIIQQGIGLEVHLLDYSHSVAVLAFQVADATIKNIISAFSERRQAISAEIMAILEEAKMKVANNTNLIDLFSAKVRASFSAVEASKMLTDAQISGFTARTQSAAEKSRQIVEVARNKIDYNNGQINLFNSKINGIGIKGRLEADRVNAVARGYEAETAVFKAIADFDISKGGLDIKVLEARINQAIANAGLTIKDKEIEQKNYELINALKMEAMKAIGAVAAQLVAGALSSAHAQASIGASQSYSESDIEVQQLKNEAAAAAAET